MWVTLGLLGRSRGGRMSKLDGCDELRVPVPADRFGEGLTLLNGILYQLTWKAGVAYVYDASTLALQDSFNYAGEGWGLATDGTSLIMSDGTSDGLVLRENRRSPSLERQTSRAAALAAGNLEDGQLDDETHRFSGKSSPPHTIAFLAPLHAICLSGIHRWRNVRTGEVRRLACRAEVEVGRSGVRREPGYPTSHSAIHNVRKLDE